MGLKSLNQSTGGPSKRKQLKSKAALPASKRPRTSCSPEDESSSNDAASEDDGGDRAAMLAALEAHSRAMFGFDMPSQAECSAQGRKRLEKSGSEDEDKDDGSEGDSDGGEEYQSDDGWGADDGFVSDSEDELASQMPKPNHTVAIATNTKSKVPEVVFDSTAGRSSDSSLSKAERRAFLMGDSAKIMGLQKESDYGPNRKRARDPSEELEDQSNLKLDKSLQDMLLTTLLPSAAADSASRPVHKRNAMTGRLLELASYQLPGEGAKSASASLHSSHPAHIRTGIMKAQAKRESSKKEEDRQAGNYVKGIGGLGDGGKRGKGRGPREQRASIGVETGKKRGMESRKKGDGERARGLGMGVGKFEGGVLKLTERDARRAMGEERRGGGGRGRGGKSKRGKRR